MLISIGAAYSAQFCGAECYDEFKWRETLSIMGKQYYPRGTKLHDKD